MNKIVEKAGQELDGQVALEVLGWKYGPSPVGGPPFWQDPDRNFESGYLTPRPYSTDPVNAWHVVIKILSLSPFNKVEINGIAGDWFVRFSRMNKEFINYEIRTLGTGTCEAEGPWEAICEAALEVVRK